MSTNELRLPLPEFESLAPAEQRVHQSTTLTLTRMLAHATGIATPFLQFVAALNTSGLLTERQREIVVLRTAALAESEYEWVQHAARAQSAGMTSEEIEGVRAGELAGDEGDLIHLVDELVNTGTASDVTLARARQFLSVPMIVALIMTIGLYSMLAKLIATAGLTVDPLARSGANESHERPYYEALLASLSAESSAAGAG